LHRRRTNKHKALEEGGVRRAPKLEGAKKKEKKEKKREKKRKEEKKKYSTCRFLNGRMLV
jgi:hypothetical protein